MACPLLPPPVLHAVACAASPGFAVVDHALGDAAAAAVLADLGAVADAGELEVTAMGRGDGTWMNAGIRGDARCWLTPAYRRAVGARGGVPPADASCHATRALDEAVADAQSTTPVRPGLAALYAAFHTVAHELAAGGVAGVDVVPATVSIQAARFDGGGARYVRHIDAFTPTGNAELVRVATVIYYPNVGWDGARDGGALRVFTPTGTAVPCGGEVSTDVAPLGDRLLVFRSMTVAHEVLPTAAAVGASSRHRWAVTMWVYGRPRPAATTPIAPAHAAVVAAPAVSRAVPSVGAAVARLPDALQARILALAGGAGGVKPIGDVRGVIAAGSSVAIRLPQTRTTSAATSTAGMIDLDADAAGADAAALSPQCPHTCVDDSVDGDGSARERCAGTIFVAIPAYRDPQLQHTLLSLFRQARHPERVSVGVCWQFAVRDGAPAAGDGPVAPTAADAATCFDPHTDVRSALPPSLAARVRVVALDARLARGPSWARHVTVALFDGEDFVLHSDSHMRFARHWDVAIIDQLRDAERQQSARRQSTSPPSVVISAYPQGFSLDSATGRAVVIVAPSADDDGSGVAAPGVRDAADNAAPSPPAPPLPAPPLPRIGLPRHLLPTAMVCSPVPFGRDDGMPRFTGRVVCRRAAGSGCAPVTDEAALAAAVTAGRASCCCAYASAAASAASDSTFAADPSCASASAPAAAGLLNPPFPALFVAAGFAFARGTLLAAAPPDPRHAHGFFGEEASLLLRAWTRGWDVYAPGVTLAWHLWSRGGRPTFREHGTGAARRAAALDSVRTLFAGHAGSGGDWGLGSTRSLGEWEALSGVSLAAGRVGAGAAAWTGGLSEGAFVP